MKNLRALFFLFVIGASALAGENNSLGISDEDQAKACAAQKKDQELILNSMKQDLDEIKQKVKSLRDIFKPESLENPITGPMNQTLKEVEQLLKLPNIDAILLEQVNSLMKDRTKIPLLVEADKILHSHNFCYVSFNSHWDYNKRDGQYPYTPVEEHTYTILCDSSSSLGKPLYQVRYEYGVLSYTRDPYGDNRSEISYDELEKLVPEKIDSLKQEANQAESLYFKKIIEMEQKMVQFENEIPPQCKALASGDQKGISLSNRTEKRENPNTQSVGVSSSISESGIVIP